MEHRFDLEVFDEEATDQKVVACAVHASPDSVTVVIGEVGSDHSINIERQNGLTSILVTGKDGLDPDVCLELHDDGDLQLTDATGRLLYGTTVDEYLPPTQRTLPKRTEVQYDNDDEFEEIGLVMPDEIPAPVVVDSPLPSHTFPGVTKTASVPKGVFAGFLERLRGNLTAANERKVCKCWFSINSGPNGECEKCGGIPEVTAPAPVVNQSEHTHVIEKPEPMKEVRDQLSAGLDELQAVLDEHTERTIKIEIEGGCLRQVHNLPPGWNYYLLDWDDLKEQVGSDWTAKQCLDYVANFQLDYPDPVTLDELRRIVWEHMKVNGYDGDFDD